MRSTKPHQLTVHVEHEVVVATKIAAARSNKTLTELFSEALRRHPLVAKELPVESTKPAA